jgi:DNA gyrase subunit B
MADADVDGSHIKTLLLTMFFRHMRELIELGYIYVAKPPLYRVKHKGKNHYFMNDEALDAYRAEQNGKVEAARFKGLGEMNPDELWETTLDPERRTLMRVTMEDAALADILFQHLMGDDVEERKNYIQRNAKDVRFLDI